MIEMVQNGAVAFNAGMEKDYALAGKHGIFSR
jgi:hypothetical protein